MKAPKTWLYLIYLDLFFLLIPELFVKLKDWKVYMPSKICHATLDFVGEDDLSHVGGALAVVSQL